MPKFNRRSPEAIPNKINGLYSAELPLSLICQFPYLPTTNRIILLTDSFYEPVHEILIHISHKGPAKAPRCLGPGVIRPFSCSINSTEHEILKLHLKVKMLKNEDFFFLLNSQMLHLS